MYGRLKDSTRTWYQVLYPWRELITNNEQYLATHKPHQYLLVGPAPLPTRGRSPRQQRRGGTSDSLADRAPPAPPSRQALAPLSSPSVLSSIPQIIERSTEDGMQASSARPATPELLLEYLEELHIDRFAPVFFQSGVRSVSSRPPPVPCHSNRSTLTCSGRVLQVAQLLALSDCQLVELKLPTGPRVRIKSARAALSAQEAFQLRHEEAELADLIIDDDSPRAGHEVEARRPNCPSPVFSDPGNSLWGGQSGSPSGLDLCGGECVGRNPPKPSFNFTSIWEQPTIWTQAQLFSFPQAAGGGCLQPAEHADEDGGYDAFEKYSGLGAIIARPVAQQRQGGVEPADQQPSSCCWDSTVPEFVKNAERPPPPRQSLPRNQPHHHYNGRPLPPNAECRMCEQKKAGAQCSIKCNRAHSTAELISWREQLSRGTSCGSAAAAPESAESAEAAAIGAVVHRVVQVQQVADRLHSPTNSYFPRRPPAAAAASDRLLLLHHNHDCMISQPCDRQLDLRRGPRPWPAC